MYFWNFVIISKCKKKWPFHLNKLKSSLPRNAFCRVCLKLAKCFYKFWLFCNYLPLEKCVAFGSGELIITWPQLSSSKLWMIHLWYYIRHCYMCNSNTGISMYQIIFSGINWLSIRNWYKRHPILSLLGKLKYMY